VTVIFSAGERRRLPPHLEAAKAARLDRQCWRGRGSRRADDRRLHIHRV